MHKHSPFAQALTISGGDTNINQVINLSAVFHPKIYRAIVETNQIHALRKQNKQPSQSKTTTHNKTDIIIMIIISNMITTDKLKQPRRATYI